MLTENQASIVYRNAGDAVVFAPPGSGKTTVLTHHVAHVIQSGVPPKEILILTFTKQAANDLKRRLLEQHLLSESQIEAIHAGTFHAVCFRELLKRRPDLPTLLRSTEQYACMEEAVSRHHGYLAISSTEVQKYIQLRTFTAADPVHHTSLLTRRDVRVLDTYELLKHRRKQWDYDDILLEYRTVSCNGEPFQEETKSYVLVDEYQDTNQCQWDILSNLKRKCRCSLFVVGDDDQSIYAFRGASPRWLLDFPKLVPGSENFSLTTNFRSDETIVRHAKRLISRNEHRVKKDYEGVSKISGTIEIWKCDHEDQEANKVREFVLQHESVGSVAVLARTRRQLIRVFKLCYMLSNVEFRTFHDSKGKEWDHVIILGAIAPNPYLAVHTEDADDEEERRLFYVAVTRARHTLQVMYASRVSHKRVNPSPYIRELVEEFED